MYVLHGVELLDRGRGYVPYFVGVYSTIAAVQSAIERDNRRHNEDGKNLTWNTRVSLPPPNQTRVFADSQRDDGVLVHYSVHHVVIDKDFDEDEEA